MDDICTSFPTRDEAKAAMKRLSEVFAEANMHLHKSRQTGDAAPAEKVLGMIWRTEEDQLAVCIPKTDCPTSKRELLSNISKTFDPLGVLSPWLIGGKVQFQRTWKIPELGWDDTLPDDLQREVRIWWEDAHLHSRWFPRSLAVSESAEGDECTFHVFCDASQLAYCAAVYLLKRGESRLVMAKSRLAPMEANLTIPRMELMAALIGTRLVKFIQDALQLQEPRVVFWTDSMDVLYWLWNNKPRKTFVDNRVSSILESTNRDQWRHVGGTDNPADLGTRGLTIAALSSCDKWWEGPTHLMIQSHGLQPSEIDEPSDEAKKETRAENRVRVTTMTTTTPTAEQKTQVLFDFKSCSRLKQLVERTAWVKRFVHNVRNKDHRISGMLTAEERREALNFWIRDAQEQFHAVELQCVKRGDMVPAGSPLTKLRPQLSEDGLLCAIPRTNEPPLTILPGASHITNLIVTEAHQRCFHQGTRATLAQVSADYMIRRRSVKQIVNSCRRCRRYTGTRYHSVDGKLPAFRTEPSRPFSKVGIDFFGPLYVDGSQKVWVLLITCATSRAVHLELVKSQGVDDVKRALRRFFALRSTPELIYSDNARTFHALVPHLPPSVKWKFIPEAAPWWGGFWERLVGITKRCLKITLHQCHLSFDELAVTLYELGFYLNLRPLTSSDEEPLTPAHLLFGVTSIRGVVSYSGDHIDPIDRAWRHRRRVGDHLIRRWIREYVTALRGWSVSPRGRPTRIPAVGDVVLVHGEGPRSRWPMARVDELIAGSDGHCRAAVVYMRGKRTRRPINKLFQLEAAQ